MIKCLSNKTNCIQVVKSSKQTFGASDQKTNGIKKAAPTPSLNTSLTTKPSQPSTSSRTTNNSLSNLFPVPTQKTPLLTPVTQPLRSRTTPPQPSSNNYNVHSRSPPSNSAHIAPLTVQTGSTVKVESPQMSSLNSPATLSAVDRLAPIRAVKASLASGTNAQFPSVNRGSEVMAMPIPGPCTPQTPVDLRQNPAVPPSPPYQTTVLSQQPPPPPPPSSSVQSLSQHFPSNPGQGRPIPAQVEGVLKNLRSQFPQLGRPSQGMGNNAVNPATSGQNMQSGRMDGHSIMPPSMPGLVNTGSAINSGHVSHGYGVGTPQVTYNGNIRGAQANPQQVSGLHVVPPWPSSSLGMSGDMPSQPQPQPPLAMNFSAPTPGGLHALPQRPAVVASTPRNSMRAEPLGPPSRSASSESMISDGRRGSYNKGRHRPSGDRRPNRYDRNQDINYDQRNRFRSRS